MSESLRIRFIRRYGKRPGRTITERILRQKIAEGEEAKRILAARASWDAMWAKWKEKR